MKIKLIFILIFLCLTNLASATYSYGEGREHTIVFDNFDDTYYTLHYNLENPFNETLYCYVDYYPEFNHTSEWLEISNKTFVIPPNSSKELTLSCYSVKGDRSGILSKVNINFLYKESNLSVNDTIIYRYQAYEPPKTFIEKVLIFLGFKK